MHPDLSKNLPSARPRGIVKHMKSREIVEDLWDEVWNAHDPDALDRFVTDDVVVVAGGQEISGKDKFKASIKELLDKVNDLHLDAIETFQNEDGTRVTSRWVLTGTNNGVLGTEPNQKPIAMTGTAIWEVREDGKLVRNTVEQASFELYHYLLEK
ncbi:MAG: nuclear transport factor 2 family protein [Mycobacterium sp.]